MPESYEQIVERLYPWIEWREPIQISLIETHESGFACRFCVARSGFRARDVGTLAKTIDECRKHIKECHSENRSAHP